MIGGGGRGGFERRVVCKEFSPGYYGLCTVGGMLSAGITHLAITPLDVLKVNMQVSLSGFSSKASIFALFLVPVNFCSGIKTESICLSYECLGNIISSLGDNFFLRKLFHFWYMVDMFIVWMLIKWSSVCYGYCSIIHA